MKVKLNGLENTGETSFTNFVISIRESHFKAEAIVINTEIDVWFCVVILELERTQIFVISCLSTFNVDWRLLLPRRADKFPISRAWNEQRLEDSIRPQ